MNLYHERASPNKALARAFCWLDAYQNNSEGLCQEYNLFLAGARGQDILTARALGINNLAAVERDQTTFLQLIKVPYFEGCRVFHEEVETATRLVSNLGKISLLVLDYCGTWDTFAKATVECLHYLPRGSQFSITVERGRNKGGFLDHSVQGTLDRIRISLSEYEIFCTQAILYQSKDDNSKGSPMITTNWTLGQGNAKTEIINLYSRSYDEWEEILKNRFISQGGEIDFFQMLLGKDTNMTTESALKSWKTRRKNAKKRSDAAKKAWATRRKNEWDNSTSNWRTNPLRDD